MSQTNARFQGGGIVLPQGSSPGSINVGEQALILDSDGTAKLQASDGTKTSIGSGGFGSDTLVQLPNSAAALKTVSEWISSYFSNTAGNERSQVEIKVLQAGAQATGLKLVGSTEAYLPDYIGFNQDPNSGIWRSAANTITMYIATSQVASFNATGLALNGGVGAQLSWAGTTAGLAYTSGTGMLKLTPAASGNVDLGAAAGALLTTATSGFPTMPTCAGAATGAATVTAGQAAFIYDSTNNKIYVRSGGTWRSTAALT